MKEWAWEGMLETEENVKVEGYHSVADYVGKEMLDRDEQEFVVKTETEGSFVIGCGDCPLRLNPLKQIKWARAQDHPYRFSFKGGCSLVGGG